MPSVFWIHLWTDSFSLHLVLCHNPLPGQRRIFRKNALALSLAASWNVLRRMSEKMGNCQQILWCAVRGTVRGCGTSFPGIYEKNISVRDTFVQKHLKENFYHGLLLGILSFKGGWMVRSNRESGNGFSDIMIQIDDSDTGIIIEVKYSETNDLEAECRKALRQINDTGYT